MLLLCVFAAESLMMKFLLELLHSGLLSLHSLHKSLTLLLHTLQLQPKRNAVFPFL